MTAWNRVAVLVAAVTLVAEGCSSTNGAGFAGSSSPADNSLGGPSSSGGGNSGTSQGAGGGSGGSSGGKAALPPEMKSEGNYQSPVATGQFVWIANPTSGRVAYIDANSFEVQTLAAGNGPTYLAGVPNATNDVAIVLNVLSHDATLMSRDRTTGTLATKTFSVTSDANSWAVSTSGKWAIAWTNATLVSNPDPTQGFQDIAVLDLNGAGGSTALGVGYRPVQVALSGESRAFVVTQDGISVVDLASGPHPKVTQNFPLSAPSIPPVPEASTPSDAATDGEAGPPASEASTSTPVGGSSSPDVSFTPDGAYALVRRDGVAAITVVTLADGTLTSVALPSAPTDLDLSPKGDFALAVLRDSASVAVLPVPGIVGAPASFTTIPIPGEIIGRAIVTKDNNTAILFTTVVPVEHLTVVTLSPSPAVRTVILHAPVSAVFPTDDAQSAIVLHAVTPGLGTTVKGAFSVVPLTGNLPGKIVGVAAPPTAVALSPTSDSALISIRDDSSMTYGTYLAAMPSLTVTPYTLASPPIAVGIVAAAKKGYAAQDFSEGRISFIGLSGTGVRTITGFELGAGVVIGGDQ